MSVYIPERKSFADRYINDCLEVAPDTKDEVKRSQEVPPLIIYSIFRPLDKDDPIPQSKIMLAWLIDTITTRVYLSLEKAIDWANEIRQILKWQRVTTKELERVIGSLKHAGYILPVGRC